MIIIRQAESVHDRDQYARVELSASHRPMCSIHCPWSSPSRGFVSGRQNHIVSTPLQIGPFLLNFPRILLVFCGKLWNKCTGNDLATMGVWSPAMRFTMISHRLICFLQSRSMLAYIRVWSTIPAIAQSWLQFRHLQAFRNALFIVNMNLLPEVFIHLLWEISVCHPLQPYGREAIYGRENTVKTSENEWKNSEKTVGNREKNSEKWVEIDLRTRKSSLETVRVCVYHEYPCKQYNISATFRIVSQAFRAKSVVK